MTVLFVTSVSGGVYFALLCGRGVLEPDEKNVFFIQSSSRFVGALSCIRSFIRSLIGFVGPSKGRRSVHTLHVRSFPFRLSDMVFQL